MELARDSCGTSEPLFDVVSGACVRFCNMGYWADFEARRCKRCPDQCISCLSAHRCVRCPQATVLERFVLDNVSGSCIAREKTLWERNPQRTMSTALAALCFTVFLCGLCAFNIVASQGRKPQSKKGSVAAHALVHERIHSAQGGYRGPARPWNVGNGKAGGEGHSFLRGPEAAGYAKVSADDVDLY
ncbi:unnamed protein product [Polarella glacialis]|nr:unnamed protein product [Polarella glacialis]